MTLDEMEQGLRGLQDNMTVQGTMMYRLENHVDRLEAVIAENSGAIADLTAAVGGLAEATKRNTESIGQLTEALADTNEVVSRLADRTTVLEAAMERLFDRMDRFIRGLESNGRKGGGKRKRPN